MAWAAFLALHEQSTLSIEALAAVHEHMIATMYVVCVMPLLLVEKGKAVCRGACKGVLLRHVSGLWEMGRSACYICTETCV